MAVAYIKEEMMVVLIGNNEEVFIICADSPEEIPQVGGIFTYLDVHRIIIEVTKQPSLFKSNVYAIRCRRKDAE